MHAEREDLEKRYLEKKQPPTSQGKKSGVEYISCKELILPISHFGILPSRTVREKLSVVQNILSIALHYGSLSLILT